MSKPQTRRHMVHRLFRSSGLLIAVMLACCDAATPTDIVRLGTSPEQRHESEHQPSPKVKTTARFVWHVVPRTEQQPASSIDIDRETLDGKQRADCLGTLSYPKVPAAHRAAQNAIAENPSNASLWAAMGMERLRGQYAITNSGNNKYARSAEACWRVADRLDSNHRPTRHLELLTLLARPELAAGRAKAEALLAATPDDHVAWAALADIELEALEYESAREASAKAHELHPSTSNRIRAAYFAWLFGETADAKRLAYAALENERTIDPPNRWAEIDAARLLWEVGDYDAAWEAVVAINEQTPNYGPGLVLRARVAISRKDPDRANYAKPAWNWGRTGEGGWMALDASAGTASPSDLSRFRHKASSRAETAALFLAVKGEDLDRALRLAEASYRKKPSIEHADTLAWVHFKRGNVEEALSFGQRANRLQTSSARLRYHFAEILNAAGQKERARKLVAEALELNPEFDLVEAVSARTLSARLGPETGTEGD